MKRIATFGTVAATAMLASLLGMPVQAQQTGSGTTAGSTTGTTSGSAATANTSGASGSTAGSGSMKNGGHAHGTSSKTRHHAHTQTHSTAQQHANGMMSQGESAYRAELRQCVEGPANNRDTCIDQAIQHHGG